MMKKSKGGTIEKIRMIISIISLGLTIYGLLKKLMDWHEQEEI